MSETVPVSKVTIEYQDGRTEVVEEPGMFFREMRTCVSREKDPGKVWSDYEIRWTDRHKVGM